ncbi:hypothetical protein DID74_00840 [Candidatus Marinamargulisbacteria bacterium SCGC AG-333-B06]|nr:hypothetical protein DID74_00840 [Candidatus Marinamargulisbacteria bacterium SCGC AG-333-B06]
MYKIFLVGYVPDFFQRNCHTNFWPWKYITQTLNEIGYKAFHRNADDINHSNPNIYICWNEPDTVQLIKNYKINKNSILIQKLTSFDTSEISQKSDWTDNPIEFFKTWTWPQYQKLNELSDSGYKFFAFGAKTETNAFPVKKKLVSKFKDYIFWIPWGSMIVPYKEIQKSKPILSDFKYDLGFVGSKWGKKNRGNIDNWDSFLMPLLEKKYSTFIAGSGTEKGTINIKKHISILKKSKLCPILHASSWKAEKGVMDRFWTIFSLGRFGVIDNEGVFDFFNKDEVVYAESKEEYLDKSMYYLENVEKQEKYIGAILDRIKNEYNQNQVWSNIMKKVLMK